MKASMWAGVGVAIALASASVAWAGQRDPVQPAATSAGGAPALDEATFLDPPLSVRPMYRWWLPLAAVDDAELRREIDEMADAGAGGIEIDAMPAPGDLGKSRAFLDRYGFGTAHWSHVLETIYAAGKRRGLKIDFMASAAYPSTVPTVSQINNRAAQQKLVFTAEEIQPGATWDGPLPQPETAPVQVGRLCGSAAAGETRALVASPSNYAVGDVVVLGSRAKAERAAIAGVSTVTGPACAGDPAAGGSGGAGLGELAFTSPLGLGHEAGDAVAVVARRTLVAAVVAQCATPECPATGGVRMLDPATTRDVTAQVDPAGRLRWSAPAGGAPWWLLAFFQAADGQVVSDLSATSPNFVIDHLGVAGARALTDFYDRAILTPDLRRLMRSAPAASMFEDSFEPDSGLKWTWGFLDEFARRRGYALPVWLPALTATDVGARRPAFDFAVLGERVREDYRQTWSDLYVDHHARVYNDWLHKLGLKSRIQVEGGPMEVADVAAEPDTPEGENRNFLNNPELWKVVGVGAQLRTPEALLSDECCPVAGGVWATTAAGKAYAIAAGTGAPYGGAGDNANLNWVHKAYAGGVNQLVWHGFPYIKTPAGTGESSRWPGNTFNGLAGFAEAFGARMPQWPDYRAINDHLARLQLVLRQGHPVYDVVVFWHDFGVRGIAPNILPYTGYPGLSQMLATTSSLDGAGYTYQYLSPHYLDRLSAADVRDGRLLPGKLDAGALILYRQAAAPVESLRRVRDLTRAGRLPIIVVGAPPSRAVGGAKTAAEADAEVQAIIAEFRTMSRAPGVRVAFVDDDAGLLSALARFGVEPSVARRSDPGSSDILAVRRRLGDTDYYYLFNQATRPASQVLSFAGQGQPVELDTWSGRIEALGLYDSAGGRVSLPLRIAANDVKVIAIRHGLAEQAKTQIHAIRSDAEVRSRNGRLLARVDHPGIYTTQLSDGRSVRTRIRNVAPAIPLSRWTLQIESWTPDATGEPGLQHTRRTKLAPIQVTAAAGGSLPAWAALGHGDVAGLGVYTTTVALPPSWSSSDGACLDLGTVVDTFRVFVNTRPIPPTSPQDTACIDLGQVLRPGQNRIVVRVATPLRNAVVASTGAKATKLSTYGLSGPVTFRPYRDVALKVGEASP